MSLAIPRHGGTAEAPAGTILPGLRVAAAASLGAGAIHAAAAGAHAAHIGLARLFIIFAAAQLVAGGLALLRPSRLVAWAVAVVNVAAVGGWALTRVTGISWIDGLQVREAPQFADVVCAGLGALAVAGAIAALLIGWQHSSSAGDESGRATLLSAIPIVAIAALAVPAMLTGGTSAHAQNSTAAAAHDHGASPSGGDSGAAPAATTSEHDHSATADSVTTTTLDESQPHNHDASGNAVPITTTPGELATDGTAVRAWPRPWDPSQPIDVGGVQGVSTVEEARATQLIQGTLADLPRYADPAAAEADGYASIGDGATGSEHYIKSSLIEDGDMLDPAAPESLVYDVEDGTKTLAGAMYIVSARPLDDPSLTEYAGPLMTWHEHNNLCWGVGADGKPKVVGLTDADGNCANGVKAGGENPMVHVWIVPRACGVFSALEGVGEGTAAVPQDQRTDTCAAAESTHDHGASTSPSTSAGSPA
jgi:hypothetical protein